MNRHNDPDPSSKSLRHYFYCRFYNVFGTCIRGEDPSPCVAEAGRPCKRYVHRYSRQASNGNED